MRLNLTWTTCPVTWFDSAHHKAVHGKLNQRVRVSANVSATGETSVLPEHILNYIRYGPFFKQKTAFL